MNIAHKYALIFAGFMTLAAGAVLAQPDEFITQTNAQPVLNDPFNYQRGHLGEGGYVPASDSSIPPGIRVLAIIEVKGRPSYAALKIPSLHGTVYAKSGDAIRLESAEISPGKSSAAPPLYLLVQKVSKNGVEISPQERPSDIHVFQ